MIFYYKEILKFKGFFRIPLLSNCSGFWIAISWLNLSHLIICFKILITANQLINPCLNKVSRFSAMYLTLKTKWFLRILPVRCCGGKHCRVLYHIISSALIELKNLTFETFLLNKCKIFTKKNIGKNNYRKLHLWV